MFRCFILIRPAGILRTLLIIRYPKVFWRTGRRLLVLGHLYYVDTLCIICFEDYGYTVYANDDFDVCDKKPERKQNNEGGCFNFVVIFLQYLSCIRPLNWLVTHHHQKLFLDNWSGSGNRRTFPRICARFPPQRKGVRSARGLWYGPGCFIRLPFAFVGPFNYLKPPEPCAPLHSISAFRSGCRGSSMSMRWTTRTISSPNVRPLGVSPMHWVRSNDLWLRLGHCVATWYPVVEPSSYLPLQLNVPPRRLY